MDEEVINSVKEIKGSSLLFLDSYLGFKVISKCHGRGTTPKSEELRALKEKYEKLLSDYSSSVAFVFLGEILTEA